MRMGINGEMESTYFFAYCPFKEGSRQVKYSRVKLCNEDLRQFALAMYP